jgi:nuclear pore complex protein Nup188
MLSSTAWLAESDSHGANSRVRLFSRSGKVSGWRRTLNVSVLRSSAPFYSPLSSSWRTVFIALSKPDDFNRDHSNLEDFLSEPYVLQLLGRPYNPFSYTPKTPTKSTFETKTAAINVTPTTKKDYDIAEIKEDALWLSKEAEIDEVSALRLVVLEYQTRSAAKLQSDFSDEERIFLQEAAENGSAELSGTLPRTKLAGAVSDELGVNFDSKDIRRVRVLRLYLSERRYLLKSAGLFFQAALDQQNDPVEEAEQNGVGESGAGWVHHVGADLLASLEKAGRSMHDCLIDSIRALRDKFKRLDRGSGWLKQEGSREDLEIDWLCNIVIEAVSTMEITIRILDKQNHIPSSEAVLDWFRFVSTYGFFDQFEHVCRYIVLLC